VVPVLLTLLLALLFLPRGCLRLDHQDLAAAAVVAAPSLPAVSLSSIALAAAAAATTTARCHSSCHLSCRRKSRSCWFRYSGPLMYTRWHRGRCSVCLAVPCKCVSWHVLHWPLLCGSPVCQGDFALDCPLNFQLLGDATVIVLTSACSRDTPKLFLAFLINFLFRLSLRGFAM